MLQFAGIQQLKKTVSVLILHVAGLNELLQLGNDRILRQKIGKAQQRVAFEPCVLMPG